jgi:hypothetical protein
VIPETLIQDIIRENHNLLYVIHPRIHRTYNLVSLSYRWPAMRKSIDIYIRNCDTCQRRKSPRNQIATLGEVEATTFPIEITAMDITGPYPPTSRKNKYLLTFVDYFTRYLEAYPISEQTTNFARSFT